MDLLEGTAQDNKQEISDLRGAIQHLQILSKGSGTYVDVRFCIENVRFCRTAESQKWQRRLRRCIQNMILARCAHCFNVWVDQVNTRSEHETVMRKGRHRQDDDLINQRLLPVLGGVDRKSDRDACSGPVSAVLLFPSVFLRF